MDTIVEYLITTEHPATDGNYINVMAATNAVMRAIEADYVVDFMGCGIGFGAHGARDFQYAVRDKDTADSIVKFIKDTLPDATVEVRKCVSFYDEMMGG